MTDERVGNEFHEGEDVRDLSVLKDRLIAKLGHKEYEVLWAVFIKPDGTLKGIEQLAEGDDHSVGMPHDEILARVKAAGVNKFALLHNHPGDSGDATPSKQDQFMTFMTLMLGRVEGLQLVDHLIVNRDNVGSIRQQRNL
jgi:DNA repair protein RadC